MTFVKGQSGNPKGRPPVDRSFADSLRAQLALVRNGVTTKERIAAAMVEKAVNGDLEAARWIVDRTEGKTPDKLETTLNGSVSHAVADATIDAVLERYAARGRPGGGEA